MWLLSIYDECHIKKVRNFLNDWNAHGLAHHCAVGLGLLLACFGIMGYLEHQERCLHLFAIYLLAQFRETGAVDCFVRFFSLPGKQALDLTGDLVTEHGAAVFASVCGGDPAPLLRLAHDETVNEFVRGQAIDALLVQSTWGERPREAVLAELRGLFSSLPKPGNGFVWAALVGAVVTFNALELIPEGFCRRPGG